MQPAVIYALVAIVLVLCWRSLQRLAIARHGTRLRPAPNTLPLVGNGILFLQPRQKLLSWFVKCERLSGYETLRISVPTLPPGVIISNPQNLEYVFKRPDIFEKGDFFKRRSWDAFGHGIINVDGDLWRVQRKAGLHFLSTSNLRVLTEAALPRYLNQSVELLGQCADGRTAVDLQAVLHEITTQLMGKMAYNMEMHADDDFTVAFDHASEATARRFQNPLWSLTETFFGARLRKALAIIKSHGKNIVSTAVAHRKSGERHDSDRLDDVSGTLIQSLLDSIGDETLVADAALNYLTAGRDTVAQALTWTFYLLMKHEHVTSRLHNTIQQKLTADEAGLTLKPQSLTPVRLPYIMAVFYESLRLYPPIPFEMKQAQQDVTLPDGTFLPKSSVVVWCTWAMNRSKITWGDNADEFQPDRWLADAGENFVLKGVSEFPVFNGGPRLCLGKKMAELIAVQVVATLAALFEFTPAYDQERVSKDSLTLPMEGGLPVYVTRRKKSWGAK